MKKWLIYSLLAAVLILSGTAYFIAQYQKNLRQIPISIETETYPSEEEKKILPKDTVEFITEAQESTSIPIPEIKVPAIDTSALAVAKVEPESTAQLITVAIQPRPVLDSLVRAPDTLGYRLPSEEMMKLSLSDSLAGIIPSDTTAGVEKSAPIPFEPEIIHIFDLSPVVDSLEYMRASLQDIRFQLGEILLFDLPQPDSARVIFKELTTPQNADTVRARATLALAYIAAKDSNYTAYDSLQSFLADEFSQTKIGQEVAKLLGREPPKPELPPEKAAYQEAENLLFAAEPNYNEAFTRYRWIAETYPESDLAPNSLFAAAFIAGNYLHDAVTAEEIFRQLQSKYAGTPQALEAGKLLTALEAYQRSEVKSDSAAVVPTEEKVKAVLENELETPPEMIGGQEALGRLIESKNLLPPEILSGTGGEVDLRYIINPEGAPSDFHVLSEDPPGHGLAPALITALQEMAFRPGRQEGEPVATLVERRYSLPLDAPPNVRPLPKRRRR